MPASGQRHSANGATVITQHPKWRSNGLSVVNAVSVPVVQIITLLVWEPCCDETEIRHAVTVITAEYPQFNLDGLALHNRNADWENPLDNPSFIVSAKSCLRWIRDNGMSNAQIESFPQDNPTPDTLKHEVERYNQINHQHSDHPHYIPNGAFIAAMVASGYKVKPAGRMNAFFNISKKGLCAAMGKN